MREIPISKGYVVTVDDADYDTVTRYKWMALIDKRSDGSIRNVYAVRKGWKNGKRIGQLMHRALLGVTDKSLRVDHKNHNGLDNRRENLQVCTNADNCRRCRKPSDNTSGFKGVSWSRSNKHWVAQITHNKRKLYIGQFDTKQEAAAAYRETSRRLFGEFSCTE